jgi:hypothetical protein
VGFGDEHRDEGTLAEAKKTHTRESQKKLIFSFSFFKDFGKARKFVWGNGKDSYDTDENSGMQRHYGYRATFAFGN